MIKKIGIVSTPIGNLEDLSPRGRSALEKSDIIVAEDTRVTKKLLQLLQIDLKDKFFAPFHEHNQEGVVELIELCEKAKFPVLVSDAGSPLLSDPGFPFVKTWIGRGHQVISYPGPSAVSMAIELSGLPPLPFEFYGFFPRREEAIKKVIVRMKPQKSYVFFESPHRIIQSLDIICDLKPDLECFVGRELTKKFEEHYRFVGHEWPAVREDFKAKGEFVAVFHRKGEGEDSTPLPSELLSLAERYLSKPSPKGMAKLLSAITGEATGAIYDKIAKK